uniref:Uncharacterized protein n=1 Tax=Helianthus annuus TaxID=4232 RepID=A0A251SUU5_HELAN
MTSRSARLFYNLLIRSETYQNPKTTFTEQGASAGQANGEEKVNWSSSPVLTKKHNGRW